MSEFREMARDPKHRRGFEKLLRLAAAKGDSDIVIERLRWGINPNGATKKGRTALIANVRGPCPSAATVNALLAAGADPNQADIHGLTALDYARRKLIKLQSRPCRTPRKSPSLDENNQLQLPEWEQRELGRLREKIGDDKREFMRLYWQERLRAARRTFNNPDEVERIVELLEAAMEPG